MSKAKIDPALLKKHEEKFKFLEELRLSGITNMYGAVPYLTARFNISKNEASDILGDWMGFYDELCELYGWQ